MVEGFKKNTARYIDMFTQVTEELMPKRQKAVNPDDVNTKIFRNTNIDLKIYLSSRGEIIWTTMLRVRWTITKEYQYLHIKITMWLSCMARMVKSNLKLSVICLPMKSGVWLL